MIRYHACRISALASLPEKLSIVSNCLGKGLVRRSALFFVQTLRIPRVLRPLMEYSTQRHGRRALCKYGEALPKCGLKRTALIYTRTPTL